MKAQASPGSHLSSPNSLLNSMLVAKFPQKWVSPVIKHFQESASEAQLGNWELSIVKAGKFVEAVLKLLWDHVGKIVPPQKDFKAGQVITELEKIPGANADDTIRLTIPRACRFIYEVASNRGARHDSSEIDPNEMDGAAVTSLSSWILAELIRYAQKGSLSLEQATDLVKSLSQKKYSAIEEIDGRVYFHLKDLSARDVGLLILWHAHPNRIDRVSLIDGIMRHGSSEANAKMGISRLKHVDKDKDGKMRLLVPGINEAEQLLKTKKSF
jgi:hypothetical protein